MSARDDILKEPEDSAHSLLGSELDRAVSGDRDVASQLEATATALDNLITVLSDVEAAGFALTHVCEHAAHMFPDADGASVTLIHDGHATTAALTDDLARRLDEVQNDTQEGPIFDAFTRRTIVRFGRDHVDAQWPTLGAALAEEPLDAGAFLCAPLSVDNEHVGTLNLYSRSPSGFDPIDAAALRIYTRATEAELQAAARARRAHEQIDGLIASLTARGPIEQCKGVIMASFGVDEERAFDLLVWQSQRTNVKVRDLAERVMKQVPRLGLPAEVADTVGAVFMGAHQNGS